MSFDKAQTGNIPRTLFFIILLSACSQGDDPVQSWSHAAQGTYSAALSSTGEYVFIGSIQHGGSLWRLTDHERLYNWNHRKGEYTGIVAASFSPDDKFVVTTDHRTIVLWEIEKGAPLGFWNAPGDIEDVALSPDGNFALLALRNHTAVYFDVKNGGEKQVFHHSSAIRSVAITADGKFALTGSDDYHAKLWDLQSGRLIHQWKHEERIQLVSLSAKGNKALSVAKYDSGRIWDTQSGQLLFEMPLHGIANMSGSSYTTATFSSDEQLLLAGSSSGAIHLWDLQAQEMIKHWLLPKKNAWKPTSASVMDLSFGNLPGQYFAVSSDGSAHELKR